ncbi:hypothetical protein [Nocardia sp. NPDC052566]|uniref:hypothetical protein n=1 Tax=Nocardia sp. NPDC052566 TaxID=3364330 RepID=UPI0037C52B0D
MVVTQRAVTVSADPTDPLATFSAIVGDSAAASADAIGPAEAGAAAAQLAAIASAIPTR